MKRVATFAALAVVGAVACRSDAPTAPTELVLQVQASDDQDGGGRHPFRARLLGAEEVPPRATHAHGQAHFLLSKDGTSLSYRLQVVHINNVIASHIHLGAFGANGPIVVFLFGPVPPGGGPSRGQIAEGTITAANFIGLLAGKTMPDLLAAIAAGGAYVNVHTNDGVDPPNTGPGDFPGGEIRGQMK